MEKKRLVIGTRGSKLALWQAKFIAAAIREEHPETVIVTKIIQTTGDRMQNIALSKIGGKGLFTKEIEEAMMAGEIDLAVHSLKDVPTELPAGLELAVITKRENPGDALVSTEYDSLATLPFKAKVGTSSLRRGAQLLHTRPDLQIIPLRGNVDTRLAKLDAGEMDAIVLAVAGLKRLGLSCRIQEILSHEVCLPAVGQGALALEIRENDEQTRSIIDFLDDSSTRIAVEAERAFLAELEGNCQVPFGVFGKVKNERVELEAAILTLDGKISLRDKDRAYLNEAKALGVRLAQKLGNAGGRAILADLQNQGKEGE